MTTARRSIGKAARTHGTSAGDGLPGSAFDKLLPLAAAAVLFWGLSILEWLRAAQTSPPNPLMVTAVACAFSLFAAWRIAVEFRGRHRLRREQQGDRALAELLARMSAKGFRVFADVPGDEHTIDHVIVCAQGIYVIEIDDRSRSAAGIVHYDGETIRVNGSGPDGRGVARVRAQATFLRRYLKDRTGRVYSVRPVIVFPGAQVKRTRRNADVWVTAPRTLHQWIDRDPAVLDLADVKMAANTLTRYLRAIG